MPAPDTRVSRLPRSHLPKSVRTIDDVLARDDVNSILANIASRKPHITGIIAIVLEDDNSATSYYSEMPLAKIVWHLERLKLDLLQDEDEQE